MLTETLSRLCAASPAARRSLWGAWYGLLAARYRQADWRFMNYGYAPGPEEDGSISLEPADERDRQAIQLYHHVAGAVSLEGKSVLEVGCGRGGGSSYIARYLRPRQVLGMDLSPQAVELCRKLHQVPGLSFRQGDAENLPCGDAEFDAVVNLESSHCYGSVPAFLAQVHRVLRPGGHFLWADFRRAEALPETRAQFAAAGFTVQRERRITPNVLRSLDLESETRAAAIRRMVPRLFTRSVGHFAGVRGSRVYESLRSGAVEYVSCVLSKEPGR